MLDVITLDAPAVGDRGYLVHDGSVGFVVDPQRQIDGLLERTAALGVRIGHVFETHIHNDYVSGGLDLARETGAAYHVNAADPVEFDRAAVVDGDMVQVSPRLRVQVVATPGHTFTHLAYLLWANDEVVAAFTGGCLLFGSTGRPDLLGPQNTSALARAQHRSVRRLAANLADRVAIHPGHGFGGFCAVTSTRITASTVGEQRLTNPALLLDETQFVASTLDALDVPPAYYARMMPLNLAGPRRPAEDAAPVVGSDELRRRIDAGSWVVDVRDRQAFAAGHLMGALNFPLGPTFATYVAWLTPPATPLTLIAPDMEAAVAARRELSGLGMDNITGIAINDWAGNEDLESFDVATFEELRSVARDAVILDVRRPLEWRDAHLPGAQHIPLHELQQRLDEVRDGDVWVYCRTGYRASIAASILAAHGRRPVVVDDEFPPTARSAARSVGAR